MVTTMVESQKKSSPGLSKFLFLAVSFYLIMSIVFAVTQRKFDALRLELDKAATVNNDAANKFKQLDCLAKNIYWEAASESFEGKVAVAQVTLNRVESGKFGKDICTTVYQKNIIYEKVICQFSWVCEGTWKTKPVMSKNYADSEEVAKKVYMENFRLPGLNDAMYYHADYVNPGWGKQQVAKIGHHIFYK